MNCFHRHTVPALILGLVIQLSFAQDGLYQCPEGWELRGQHCYKFFSIRHSWPKAAEICRRHGSDLVLVEDFKENNYTQLLAEKELSEEPSPEYWLGLKTVDDLSTHTLESASGSFISQYAGFWSLDQPTPSDGECVYGSLAKQKQTWKLGTCESLRPFLCRVAACPEGSYHCSNGRCINAAFKCDGQNDCGDLSDEMDCPNLCHFYMKSSGDSIESPNYPQKYGTNLDCKWTLEGPEGYNIVLQFSELDTEKNFDTVQILSGGRTEDSAVTIATLSGQQPALSSRLFVSASNLMLIKFKSDASVEKKGFRASWKTEPKSCGGNLIATSQPQVLTSPNYPQPYPGGLECLYIIKGISGRLISLEFEDIDLEYGKDFILIRNGASPSDPRLMTITGNLTDNNRFLSSVANKLYLFIRTDFGESGRGFKIKYFSGCKASLENTHGTVNSPAYGVLPYPNNQECTYHIKHPSNGPLSLKFVDFEVDDNDFVQVYDGENEGSIRLYPGDGFTGRSKPNIVLTASSGHMYIKFKTDPLKSALGWKAEFSADCPVLNAGEGASSSGRDTHFGTKVIFKCPLGQEFATGVNKIVTQCQNGGKWTVDYIPDCQEVYCGPVPQIDNGFAIAATNVTYNGQATYQCYAGFGFASGIPTEAVRCLAEGQWETLPICLASQCPPLPDTPHVMQTILNGGGRSYGTIIRFECEPGYFRSGPPTLLCMSNGTWSGPVPMCSRIRCHEFPRIVNGFISNKDRDYFFGDDTRVQCHRGYQLVGSNTISCGPEQQFINLPKCEDINECLSTQCDAASTICTNTPGAFFCKCKSGFKPNLECRPVGDLGVNNGGIPDSAIMVSGSEVTYEKEFLRLDGPRGWCGAFQGPNTNWAVIDMQAPTVIKGFRTRSVKRDDGSDAYASILKLQFTDDLTDVFREYRTPDGTPVEFRIVAGTGPSVVNLPIPVEARFLKFIIQDFTVAPCMRLELMGCSRQDCIDINECEKENGGCHQRCLNSPGSFGCGCNLGYELFTANGTAGFSIESGETGARDGDMYRLNKTCVPKMCPKLQSPPNGLLESTMEMYHFGDTVSFMCDFGYVMIGSPILTCTSNGEWNGTVPVCEFAKCAGLQDDPSEGLVARRLNNEDPLVGFRDNITIECNEIGKPMRNTATAGFRQCVFDPKPGFPFDYWLSGSPPGCPRIDCGLPPDTPGAEYGFFVDTSYRSSFFFGCEETFSLAGQTSKSDNVVRCQEDGTWDFGDLRCEGPVCEDPGRPPDGQQIATSYEQGSEVSFSCDRPGYIAIYSQPIMCQRSPECRVIRPLGITSGKIADSALNATTQRPNYEAKNVRLNSATGWCAQPEAFSYVSADLGKIHRIKAILVKGVITNDVVGRPTDIRFFYKKEEAESFVVYFPNFNLTVKEPGNYGELSMIMLPSSVQARYVILSIVSYDKNPCLKFELMGCEDEAEEDLLLGYDMGYPTCVDNEPPQFLNCPSEPIFVKRGSTGFEMVNFTVPTVVDNSGSIARMEIEPPGFRPPLHVFEDMMVRYLAFDYDGNIAICEINITVVDTTPPNLSCPQSYVIELVEPLEKYEVNFRDVESQIEVTDDFDSNPSLVFIPETVVIPVGNFENVTVIASDKAGNQEMCHFQVAIQATPCVAWDLQPPQSGTINCLPSDSGTGLNCLASCKPGHRFTDGEAVKTFICERKQPWIPSNVVPDCVPEDTELANYDVVSSVTYRSNGVVSPQCIPQYQGLLKQYYSNLGELLSQRCSAINVPMNVSFRASGMNVIQDNMLDINFVLRVTPEVRQPLLYDLCGSTLGLIFDLSVPSTSIVIEPLLNVSAVGNQCPPLRAVKSDVSRGFTCNIGEVLTKVDSGVPRCLHCPAGTAATDQRNCIPCPKGMYQDVTRQSECKPCPIGTFTKQAGSKSLRACVPVCGYGTHSPTGLVPCLECPKNSFTSAPPSDGFKECQPCAPNTFTHSTASSSSELCRAKCKPGFYSDTGLEPCSSCPRHFYQPLEGQTSCFECATTEQTLALGTDSRGKCQPVPCNENVCRNGGLCVAQGHATHCLCPAGFSGRFCEQDISECDSNPCYNGATCVDLPQGYLCQCPAGFSGLQCQDEEGDCQENTCPERAMCQDLPGAGDFKCLCKSGYTGPDCNVTVNPCLVSGNPCQNSAICVPLLQGRYKCECLPGWDGPICDVNVDDCSEAPCLLGANCTDLVNDFKCDCPGGFTGKRCEVKVDLCADNPCQHGLCVDHLFDYLCACNPGWTGVNCDTNIDDCLSNPCDHGSECVDLVDGYTCNCLQGYTGSRCQHTIDDCESEPCQNGATCVDGLDGFVCECRPGFVGLQCEAEIDECLSNPCNAVGTRECQDLDNDFKCICQPGYEGEFCQKNTDECQSDPCLNGGSCADAVDKFVCTCLPGWTGERCETDIGSCEFDTCLNNAECINLFEDFFCACPSGTDGKRCQIAPERCIGDPCMHGGNCQDFGSGLNCTCPVDFSGVGCQYEYDACKEGVCQNGATCQDSGPGFKCICAPGFTGELCDVDIPDCRPGLCPPGSQCIDLINDFYCKCPFNLTGEDCRKPINFNYDLYLNDESRASRASLSIPFSLASISSLTLSFWVRFSFPDDFGIYLTMYTVSSPHIPLNKRLAIQAHNLGILVNLFEDEEETFFNFRPQIPVNDGQWHHISLVWDNYSGSLTLTTDAVIVETKMGYGHNKMLDTNGWIVLGAPMGDAKVSKQLGFHGYLSTVFVWNRALDVKSEIPKQARNCRNSPVLFDGLLQQWTGYDSLSGNVERVSPSRCGDKICPLGYSEDCSVVKEDKISPEVMYCPGDIWVITKNGSATVNWDPARFVDNMGVKEIREWNSYEPGQVLSLGIHHISYVAYDDVGNSAACSFKIYVLNEFCPQPEDPEGGYQRCSDWGPGGRFKVCRIACDSGKKFSQPVPEFYTCGAEGFWRPSMSPDMPLVYPACGVADPAQRVFNIKMEFPSSVICNPAGEGVLKDRIKAALLKLNKDWHLCSGSAGGQGICNDLFVGVNCQKKAHVVRRQTDSNNVYSVEISFPANNDPIDSRNTNDKEEIKRLVESIILEKAAFDVGDTLPNVIPDPASLELNSDYKCPVGKVVVPPDCVACTFGTFYQNSTKTCELCPKETFQNELGQSVCKKCPTIGGRQGVTSMPGARYSFDCKERCSPGNYYAADLSLCQPCGFGMYQPDDGSFQCLSCPPGFTTRSKEATSVDECHEECPSGQQLDPNGNCLSCERGTFRTKGLHIVCQACPAGTTTLESGAISDKNCSLPVCAPGTFLNSTQGINFCSPCPKGTYQPSSQQSSCISCPPDTSTRNTSSISKEECTNPCAVHGEERLCDRNAHCLFKPDINDFDCECLPGFNGTGYQCVDLCDNYCVNEGVCEKNPDGEPFCQCVGSFTGKTCEGRTIFAYLAGGIAGAIVLIILVVLMIWMICVRTTRRKDPKKLLSSAVDQSGSQVNFYYGAPAPYAESIAPSHHSTYAHYYDDEEDGWEMPNFYNDTYMKEGLPSGKVTTLARSNASLYGTRQDDLYDRLRKHAYQGKRGQ